MLYDCFLYPLWIMFVFGVISAQEQCMLDGPLTINPNADVKFTVITSVTQCSGKVTSSVLQNLWAIQWIVEKLNRENFTRNVSIGFDVYDDCGLAQKTMSQALDVLDGPVLGSSTCKENSICNLGIIGSSTSNMTEAMLYALRGTKLPVVGPYASFPTSTKYDNFCRTTPNDDKYVLAALDLLKQLGLTYVAVVTTSDQYGRYMATRIQDISIQYGVCVDAVQMLDRGQDINTTLLTDQRDKTKNRSLRVVYFGNRDVYRQMQLELRHAAISGISWLVVDQSEDMTTPLDVTTDTLPVGTVVISQSSVVVAEVQQYVAEKWEKVFNGTLPSDDIEQLANCTGQVTAPKWLRPQLASTLDAVMVLISAFQRKLLLWCSDGTMCQRVRENFVFDLKEVLWYPVNYSSLRVKVEEFANAQRVVNFTTDGELKLNDDARVLDVSLVKEEKTLNVIGALKSDHIFFEDANFTTTHNLLSSICKSDCPVCNLVNDFEFAFLEGDTYLLGIFSIHDTDPDYPYKCSNFRESYFDVEAVEVFLHTTKAMFSATGIKYGAIVIDDCYSAVRAQLILSQIMSKKVILKNPNTGEALDVSRIAAVISSVGSTVSITAAMLMTEFNIPFVSASATSPDLDDRVNFPYFLRTVPSDVEQAKAMVSILKKLNMNYVSVLFVENNYGSKGKDEVLAFAEANNICIGKQPEGIPDVISEDSTTTDLNEVLTRLSSQKTDVVVYFGTNNIFGRLMAEANPKELGFIFLGSEDWGDNPYILNIGNASLGSMSMVNEAPTPVDDSFAAYLRKAVPELVPVSRNPWFVTWFEKTFQCNSDLSFTNIYDRKCNSGDVLDEERINNIVKDHRIVHTADAVKAVTKGLAIAKNKTCLVEPRFPCANYFKYISDVIVTLREVTIKRDSQDIRIFKEDGNGNVGFEINNVQIGTDGKLYYRNVGSYKDGQLNLQTNLINFYQILDGACVGTMCDHCSQANTTQSTTRATTLATPVDTDSFSLADFVIIGILGLLLITIITVCIIIVCCLKSRVRELENQLKTTQYELRTGGYKTSGMSNSITYPDIKFVNSPSGGTLAEFHSANYALNGGSSCSLPNGGVNNNLFKEGDMYLHAHHGDENEASTSSGPLKCSPRRGTSSYQSNSDSYNEQYRPPSSSYGLSSNSSFKRLDNPHIKKQPRTQLAVPPCRPELPPRDNAQPKLTQELPQKVSQENFSNEVASDRTSHGADSSKYTPSQMYNYNPGLPPYREPGTSGKSSYPMNGYQYDSNRPPTEAINLNGSMEKISRV